MNPFVFYTDGGVDGDSHAYFIDKIFKPESNYCYASKNVDPKNGGVNLQAYVGRQAQYNDIVTPSMFRVDPKNPMII